MTADNRPTADEDDRDTGNVDDRTTGDEDDREDGTKTTEEGENGSERTRATVRTSHDRPAVVAAAVRPDNTPEMDTRVVNGHVETTVERATASGLRSTVDDYVVNLTVAETVAGQGGTGGNGGDDSVDGTSTGGKTNDAHDTADGNGHPTTETENHE